MHRVRLLVVASCLTASRADAQQEFQGLSGGVAVAQTRVSINDSSLTGDLALRLEVGYRLRVPGFSPRQSVTLTPLASLAFTDVGGIDIGSGDVAFSHVDLGLQLAVRVKRVRPYAVLRRGKRTIERMEGADPINYWGTGTGWGAGLEIPITATGRGLDIGFTRLSGTFTTQQRLADEIPASLPYSGWLIAVGWSGRFRGTSPLFK